MSNGLSAESETRRNEVLRVAIMPAVGVDSYLSTRALRALRRRWLRACALVCSVFAITYGATYFLETEYLAETRFVHARGSDELGGLDRLLGQIGNIGALAGLAGTTSDSLREEDVTLLTAGGVLSRFIETRKLLPVLFYEEWDASSGDWRADLSPQDRPTMQDAVRLMQEDVLRVVDDRGSSVLSLKVRWRDAQVAAAWANDLVAFVNQQIRESAQAEASRSIEFLNRALDSTDVVATRESIFRLIEAQTKTIMLANVREDFAFRVVDPAVPPEQDDYDSPNRPIIALMAATLALLSFVIAIVWNAAARPDLE